LEIVKVFELFNQEQHQDKRPRWQKVWFIVHLDCIAALFGIMVELENK